MQDAIASQVFPAGPMGETHASNGRPRTGRTGLGRSMDSTAQWNACVTRVAPDGNPGLARSTDSVAQWVYAGAANEHAWRPAVHRCLGRCKSRNPTTLLILLSAATGTGVIPPNLGRRPTHHPIEAQRLLILDENEASRFTEVTPRIGSRHQLLSPFPPSSTPAVAHRKYCSTGSPAARNQCDYRSCFARVNE